MQTVEVKVSELEKMMKELVYTQLKTEMTVTQFVDEMKDFKDEMKDFKDEMKDFKGEKIDFKDEKIDFKSEMNKQWVRLANKMGTVIEDIIGPNIPNVAKKYFSCSDIDEVIVKTYKRNKDRTKGREFDVIVVCDDIVILNETKSSPNIDLIDKFHQFIVSGEFFDFYPHLSGKKLIPIFSSLNIREDLINYLTKRKIYAMRMRGDEMILANFEELK